MRKTLLTRWVKMQAWGACVFCPPLPSSFQKLQRLLPVPLLLLLVLAASNAYAQQWQVLANETTIATAASSYTNLALVNGGAIEVPHVVYTESNIAKVKKLQNGTWVQVGGNVSAGSATYTRIYADATGTIYVTYVDAANGNRLAVKIYNPETDAWAPLDNNMSNLYVSAGSVTNNISQYNSTPRSSLAFDSNNTPYLAYGEGAGLTPFVKKFNGTSWVTVGAGAVAAQRAVGVSIALDDSDIPYLVYANQAAANSTTGNMVLYRFANDAWEHIAVPSPLPGGSATTGATTGIRHTSIAFNAAGNPTIAYFNTGNSNRASVAVYNKTANTWSYSGSLSGRDATHINLVRDVSGNVYASFVDAVASTARSQGRVFKQTAGATTWAEMRDPSVTIGGIDEPVNNLTLAIGSDTEKPVIVYIKNNTTNTPTPVVRMFIPPAPPAVLNTSAVTGITTTTAIVGGAVISDGGTDVTERGVVYGLGANPTTANGKVADAAGGLGDFSVTLTGLTPATLYYARAYAINEGGTSYGSIVRLSTLPEADAVVTTPKQVEYLTRGVVAVRKNANEVYVGWRLLGNDPSSIAFNLYRDGVKLNETPITTSTNFVDNTTANGTYTVRPVLNGVEGAPTEPVTVWANNQFSIPLQIPASGTLPDGRTYTYTANDASVGDMDGDGVYEIVLRWAPTIENHNSGGYSGNQIFDCYRLDGTRLWRIDLGKNMPAGPHYNQFMVYDFDGDGKAEIILKTADGTIDGQGAVIGNAAVDYRNSGGWVHDGPEFLTVFNGLTGAAMATVNFQPARGNISDWGDNYGNRADRFVAAVAYLDGERPSLIMGRGYYDKLVRAAYDWRDGQLTLRWIFDSHQPGNEAFRGQGNHQMTIGDVDGDGKDEVINGSSVINDDGKPLWTYGYGHGDALHLTDMDPDRPGQEMWINLESPSSYGGMGLRLHDAKTGETLFGVPTTGDVGRSMAADIDPAHRGYEMWGSSGNLYNVKGEQIGTSRPTNGSQAVNFGIWWDGDLGRELLDGTILDKWNPTTKSLNRVYTIYNAAPVSSSNDSKKNPALTADLLGDWREEIILRRSDNTALILFTTTFTTEHRIPTLMHDPQYRTAIAWQNSGYNQPPYPSFYLGYDMETPPVANIAVKDTEAPAVSSIARQAPEAAQSNAAAVTYRVIFTEEVSGVDAADFTLTTTGNLTGTIASVTALSAAVYEVTVTDLAGEGDLRLDVNSSNTGIADIAGNFLNSGFTAGETAGIDRVAPELTQVSIASSNAKPALAKAGDVVTLQFTASEAIALPVVTIAGVAAGVTALENNSYTATHTLTEADAEGVVPFAVQFADAVGNVGATVSATTDVGTVTYDRTLPTLPSVTIGSNNANPGYAKEGDVITLQFAASEAIEAPAVTIAGQAVTATAGNSNSYTATYTMTAGDTEGAIAFTIDFSDLSGNAGALVTAASPAVAMARLAATATAAGAVIYDRTSPSIAGANVDKPLLLVPNHKMEDITVNYTITDANYESVQLSVTSNEPQNGLGDGDMDNDWEIVDEHHVRLRAERSGTGNGRVYTITITAVDKAGNTSTQTVQVTVPSNRKEQKTDTTVDTKEDKLLRIWAYPNPATSAQHFTLDLLSSSNTPLALTVVDVAGRVVESRSNVAANSSIEIGRNYQPGLYFVQVVQGTDKVVLKLVKKAE